MEHCLLVEPSRQVHENATAFSKQLSPLAQTRPHFNVHLRLIVPPQLSTRRLYCLAAAGITRPLTATLLATRRVLCDALVRDGGARLDVKNGRGEPATRQHYDEPVWPCVLRKFREQVDSSRGGQMFFGSQYGLVQRDRLLTISTRNFYARRTSIFGPLFLVIAAVVNVAILLRLLQLLGVFLRLKMLALRGQSVKILRANATSLP